MRNLIYVFLVFVLVFFLNLLLYIYVDAYRNWIKVLKYWDVLNEQSWWVDDSYNVNSIEDTLWSGSKLEKDLLLDLWIWNELTAEKITWNSDAEVSELKEKPVVREIRKKLELSQTAKLVLQKFKEDDFELLEQNDKDDLLDIAWEYPDDYLQYYRVWADVYILATRTFDEVKDIFEVLEYEMPFSLNRVNNFWDESFYINLDRADDKIRFIFEYKWEVYWVKVKKENYNTVKNIINNLN